ncbi:uncharacterized protein LOC109415846 [Aedes albopictus]|uniref:Uncharacterized protein n=1 Tax=Aedes albopictus TaxID=7160 RepID=A0ABM2A3C7_AEDAL
MSDKRRPNHYWLMNPWYNQKYIKKFCSVVSDTIPDITDENNLVDPPEEGNSSYSVTSEMELEFQDYQLNDSNECYENPDSQSEHSCSIACDASETAMDFEDESNERTMEWVR